MFNLDGVTMMKMPSAEMLRRNVAATPNVDGGLAAVEKMQANDTRGLEEFFHVLGPALLGVAFRMLGNREEAEEVLQDVLVRCWDKAGNFDPTRGRPFTWAVTMLRGLCIDRLRKAGRRVQLVALPEGMEAVATVNAEPGDRSDIEAALSLLSPTELNTLKMAVFGDLSHPEIASALAEPLGTIKSRIRRALIKVQTFLNAEPTL
jgi:RNA polymerase sigma-70 factor, ECF subfamily